MAALLAAYPQFRASRETVEIYKRFLMPLESHSLASEAMKRVIATERSFPSIAALREAYRALQRHRAVSPRPESLPPAPSRPPDEWYELGRRLGANVGEGRETTVP